MTGIFPHCLHPICLTLLYCTSLLGQIVLPGSSGPYLPARTVAQAKHRIAEIDSEIAEQAFLSMRSGTGAVGYRSASFGKSQNTVWVEVRWDQPVPIDEVVLVPAIWRNPEVGYTADGFPAAFHLLLGSEQNSGGTKIADYAVEDSLLPRVAPLVVDCSGSEAASWVRIVATSLSPRIWDERYIFQLSEIMAFSGNDNVALHADVQVSAPAFQEDPSEGPRFLVDGHVPYLMDSTRGKKSVAFVSKPGIGSRPSLTIDLGKEFPVNQISLHAPDISDTVPQNRMDDFAVPKRVEVDGASLDDFSDSRMLCEIQVNSIYESGPSLMRRFSGESCRYLRITATDPYTTDGTEEGALIGFAEIEVLSNGKNVAIGKKVEANFKVSKLSARQLSFLTDGRNFYGEVLSPRTWMKQLARRHDLQRFRPRVIGELNNLYAIQSARLRLSTTLAVVFAVAIGFILLIMRWIGQRQLAQVKERFAADMHDELGANLHTIGLLSDLVDQAKQTPDEMESYLRRIRGLTERTAIAARHCVDVHDAKELFKGFLPDLQQAAERIVVNLDHEILVQGEKLIERLPLRSRVDLLLFYKECLVNISRHSGATQLKTVLIGTKHLVRLTVSDNGRGLSESSLGTVPPSLQRRAKLLGATVRLESSDPCGVHIHLELRMRRWGFPGLLFPG